jgi:DNA polymerase III subunit epsilon
MSKIFWFDTETTGLDPKIHGLTDLAVLIENNGDVIEEFSYVVKPGPDIVVDPKALEVQGKTMEDLNNGMPEMIVLVDLKSRLLKHVDPFNPKQKFVQAGYRVEFDDGFLRELFIRNEDKYYGSWFFNARIDVLTLVAICHAYQNFPVKNFKLSTMCEFFNIPIDAHKAMNDIRATRELSERLIKCIKKLV